MPTELKNDRNVENIILRISWKFQVYEYFPLNYNKKTKIETNNKNLNYGHI